MKNCGCPSDTLSSLLTMGPADRALMSPGLRARADLAGRAIEVNRPLAAAPAVSWRSLA